MLDEKLEEIMEAIWSAGENKNYSADAIQKKCIVDFTPDDLTDLEKKGLIIFDKGEILFSSKGRSRSNG